MSRKLPPDPRAFVRLSIDFFMHPKLTDIDSPAAGWAYVTSIAVSAQSMKDGLIQAGYVERLANTTGQTVTLNGAVMSVTEALIEQNLWHRRGHDCDRCAQPPPGSLIIHDYLQHQQSAQDWNDYKAWKSRAGKAGAEARWGKTGDQHAEPAAMAAAIPAGMPADMPAGTAGALADAQRTLAQDQPPPPPQRPAPQRRTRLPETFPLSTQMRRWAEQHAPGVDVTFEHERFLTHYRGVGEPRGDWNAVWKDWMLRETKYVNRTRPAGRTVYTNGADPAAALRREEAING